MSVLIVVPVYGDLPSVLECLDALVTTVDLATHRILLVNDCGPDVDAIEKALLERIDGVTGVRYERNPENLGFVGTCNRAVTELDDTDADVLLMNSDAVPTPGFLDEMLAVLYADPRHGVVTARSNNATIASLPFRLTDPKRERTFDRTREVHDALLPYLPRWYEPPVAMGFCFLTRRDLIVRFGLFDEVFSPGYGEENDYCLRLGEAGFVSTMANRALVFHEGSKSFVGARRNTLRTAHQRELDRRYPYYGAAVQSFLRHSVAPADRFADLVVPVGPQRIVLDLRAGVALPAAIDAFLAAFPASDWSREILVDDVAAVSSGAAVTADVRVAADASDDDLVAVTVLLAERVTPRSLVRAHRRSLHLVAVSGVGVPDPAVPGDRGQDPTAVTPSPWTDAAFVSRSRDATPVLRQHAAATVVDGDWAAGAAALRSALESPLADRVAPLEARWRDLALVDAAIDDGGPESGAEVERLRAELRDLRASRTFRTGEAVARLVPKLPGRKR